MATFKSRIESYIGTVSDTSALDSWLNEEVRRLYNIFPKRKAMRYAVEVSDAGSGFNIDDKIILDVHKGGIKAKEISYADKAKYEDSTSIFYSNQYSPKYYIKGNTANVIPGGGSLLVLSIPSVTYNSSSLSIPELEEVVILGTAIKALLAFLNSDKDSFDSLSMENVRKPLAPSVPVFTYTSASGEVLTSTNITVSSSLPNYNKPVATVDFTDLETYIKTEEDGAKAEAEALHQRARLDRYQNDLYNELNEFNQEAKAYELELQKAIAEAQLTQQRLMDDAQRADNIELANRAKELEKEVSEYQAKLGKYAQEVQSYTAEINKAVQELNLNIQKIASKLGSYAGLFEMLVTKYKEALESIIRG